jgi:hypothetical protein
MNSLKAALFENPIYLYIILAITEIVLGSMWHRRRGRRRLAYLAIPIGLAVAIFALEALVVTDREYITDALREIASEVETFDGQPRLEAASRYLDESVVVDFGPEAGGMNLTREQALLAARAVLERSPITNVRFMNLDVEVHAEAADARFATFIAFTSEELGPQNASVRWTLRWARRAGGWRIVRVDKPETGL